jgi:hypothetical protein
MITDNERMIPEWIEKLDNIIKEVNMKKAIKPSMKSNDKTDSN